MGEEPFDYVSKRGQVEILQGRANIEMPVIDEALPHGGRALVPVDKLRLFVANETFTPMSYILMLGSVQLETLIGIVKKR